MLGSELGKIIKAHVLMDLLEDFVKSVVQKENNPESPSAYTEHNNAYEALHEFLVNFIDLHMDKINLNDVNVIFHELIENPMVLLKK